MKTPRAYRTSYPMNPECRECGNPITGPNALPAVTVAFPTRDPKKAKQISYCERCAPFLPKK